MPTETAIAIFNKALSHLGSAASIEHASARSNEARLYNKWYDTTRRGVLEALDWGFARRRQTLAEHSDDPPEDIWEYRYQLPSDCLAVRYLEQPAGHNADDPPFDLIESEDGETVTLVTDEEDAVLVYTRDVEAVNLFTPLFVNAMTFAMAANMAMEVTGKMVIKREMQAEAQRALITAAASSANQRREREPRDADWIRAR